MGLFIAHYTLYENGFWYFYATANMKMPPYSWFRQRNRYTVPLPNGLEVHSIMISNGDVWDCVNGWR